MKTLRRQIIESVWDHRQPCRTATQIAHDLQAAPASVSSILKKLATRKVVRRELKQGAWVYWAFLLLFVPRPATAQIAWNGPRLAPQEAADVLAHCTACLSNAANLPAPVPPRPPEPTIIVVRPDPPSGQTVFVPGPLTWWPPYAPYGFPTVVYPRTGVTTRLPERSTREGRRESETRRSPRR